LKKPEKAGQGNAKTAEGLSTPAEIDHRFDKAVKRLRTCRGSIISRHGQGRWRPEPGWAGDQQLLSRQVGVSGSSQSRARKGVCRKQLSTLTVQKSHSN
jgi:hypothetical protein